MADVLRKKLAIDELVQQELEQVQKRHPELSMSEAYSQLFSEFPELYQAYTTTTAIVSRNADAD
jgi:hypothetical protein